MSGRDPYKLLGVSRGASGEEIKKAYRSLVRRFHPDANPGDPRAEERFKEIQQAYETLSNPEKRGEYDRSTRPRTTRQGQASRRGQASRSGTGKTKYTGNAQDLLKKFADSAGAQGQNSQFTDEDLARILKLLGAGLSRNIKFEGKDSSVQVNVDFGKPEPGSNKKQFEKPPKPPKPPKP